MSEQNDIKSAINRLANLTRGQEEAQAELEKIRGSVKALLVLGLYTLALALIIFLAITYPPKGAT